MTLIHYGKRIKLSCLLFLALSSDFQKQLFKNHSQVLFVLPKPPFNIIQKFTQIVSRPNCKMKGYLFFPLSIYNQAVSIYNQPRKPIFHITLCCLCQTVLSTQKQKISQYSFVC